MPVNCPGDCQFEIIDGDWAGELSSLSDCPAEVWCIEDPVWGAIGSIPSGMCFRWPRCFSSMFRRPSLVNGFGRTSFMPAICQTAIMLTGEERTVLEVH